MTDFIRIHESIVLEKCGGNCKGNTVVIDRDGYTGGFVGLKCQTLNAGECGRINVLKEC